MECWLRDVAFHCPSSSTGMAKLAVRATGGYARVRQQFKTPIGKFEGVEEALARMGGNLYMMDAARMLTALAVDLGEKPAVLSAIAKYHLTERARKVINDAMDIAGGKGICMGPANFLGAAYMQMPVSITVEGANILTRSLIVFGQGAIRCHPYVLREITAAGDTDVERASATFDRALFGHIGFVMSNTARTLVLGLCGSHLAKVPSGAASETSRYYQQLTRFSSALAFLADVSMGVLGGALKRKEKLSARLGDVLSMLYLCSATLKRYEDEGRQPADAPMMHWAIWDALFSAQNAIEGVISNFPNRWISFLLRRMVFPLGRPYVVPSDRLGHEVARLLIEPSDTSRSADRGHVLAARRIECRRRDRTRARSDTRRGIDRYADARGVQKPDSSAPKPARTRVDAALAANIISADELAIVRRASAAHRTGNSRRRFPAGSGCGRGESAGGRVERTCRGSQGGRVAGFREDAQRNFRPTVTR